MNRIIKKIEFLRLQNKEFSLISNNCWGYELYNVLKRQYNSPFIGLFLFPECYIKLLENFEANMQSKIVFSNRTRYMDTELNYPLGIINNDIEIHFLHYSSETEALEKWNRRTSRLLKSMSENIPTYFKFCDRDGCSLEHMKRFHSLPFQNKISIGVDPYNSNTHIHCPNLKDPSGNFVINGASLYQRRYDYFDISSWILKKNIHPTIINKFLHIKANYFTFKNKLDNTSF